MFDVSVHVYLMLHSPMSTTMPDGGAGTTTTDRVGGFGHTVMFAEAEAV